MSFSSPWMLLGLTLAALPILIHLWTKREHRREPWAAMVFLQRALERRRRQLRLESLLLLLLRTVAVCLCVLALAEPRIDTGTAHFAQREPVLRVLLFDQSASLKSESGGLSGWDRVRAELMRCVADAAPGDRYALVRICRSEPRTLIREPTSDVADIEAEIGRWPPTDERGDVAASLEQVMSILQQQRERLRREVVIVSDMQASNWLPADEFERRRIQSQLHRIAELADVQVVDVGAADRNNLAVTALEASRSIAAPGETVTWTARVRNFAASPVTARLEWRVGATVEEIVPVNVPPEGEATAQCSVPSSGDWSCDVTATLLHEDRFALDNRRFASIPLRDRLRVVLVEGKQPHRPAAGSHAYVAIALDTASASGATPLQPRRIQWKTTVIPETRFAAADLLRADVVWLADVPRLAPDVATRLTAWVRCGGGLIVSLGEGVDLTACNAQLWRDGAGVLPARLNAFEDAPADQEFLAFQATVPPHRVVADLVDNPDSGLLTTLVKRWVSVDRASLEGAETVLELADQSPLILERDVGAGKSILVLTAVDDSWGNWAVWPSFLPVVHRLVALASSPTDALGAVLVGDAIERVVPPLEGTAYWKLADGKSVAAAMVGQGETVRLRLDQTLVPGFYQLEVGAPVNQRQTVTVNLDILESDPQRVSRTDLAGTQSPLTAVRWGGQWTAPVVSESLPAPGRFAGPLLLAALVVLGLEQLLAWNTNAGVLAIVVSAAAILLWRVGQVGGWFATGGVLLFLAVGSVLWVRQVTSSQR